MHRDIIQMFIPFCKAFVSRSNSFDIVYTYEEWYRVRVR